MKKRIIFVLSMVALLVCLPNSCMDEPVEGPSTDEKEQLIEAAKRMYNGSAGDGFVELRASSNEKSVNDENSRNEGNSGNLAVKPKWKTAKIEQDNTRQTVEVELQMEKGFNFATTESVQKFKESKKREYILSKTSLVYLTQEKTGEEVMFLMTIVPELSYQESTKFEPFKKMSYLNRDRKFSGYVFYHNMEGEYVNGWQYVNGEVTATIQAHTEKPDFDMVTTRSGSCEDWFLEYLVTECWMWGTVSGEITGMDCYNYYEYEYWFTGCDFGGSAGGGYSDDGSGYGGGGNNGNPPPPSPPTVTLSSASSVITLMDSYGLSVSVSPSGYSVSSVVFKINDTYILQSSNSLTCTAKARKSGYWSIQAIVNGSYSSNVVYMEVQYPHISAIESVGVVSTAMTTAWANTKSTASSSGRREEGFSVYANTQGSSLAYEVGTTNLGPTVQCGTGATIGIYSTESVSSTPLNGGRYLVAQFHTHTPFTYCDPSKWRYTGPTMDDNDNICPQLIYDYIGVEYGVLRGGHALHAPDHLYIIAMGLSRRPTD